MHFLYILKSLADGKHYVGITSNVKKRLAYHNRGYVRSTKHRIPFIILKVESFPSRIEARAREKYLKSYVGSKEKRSIIELVKNHWEIV